MLSTIKTWGNAENPSLPVCAQAPKAASNSACLAKSS